MTVATQTLEGQPCTLHREINALGGQGASEWSKGYNEALDEVLTILERRGYSEAADASTDMLAAVQQAVEELDAFAKALVIMSMEVVAIGLQIDVINKLRAAIAKATGK